MKKPSVSCDKTPTPQPQIDELYNFISNKDQKVGTSIEPDHYLQSLERYGIICYKKLGDPAHCFAFAWQIVEDPKIFMRFDEENRHFIESLAIRENQDDWYRSAGHQLQKFGFKKFTDFASIF